MRSEARWSIGLVLATISLLTLAGCTGGETPADRRPDLGSGIDALFEPATAGDSPGAAVMVIRNGEILHAAGYGYADLEHRTPITPQSSFRLASVSKQFTAMAVMILAERGQLAYDDPVVKYLPELGRFGDEITVRHLLTHTGGLPDYYDALEEVSADHMPDTEEAMEFLAGWGEVLFLAGERYEYSNPGYEMLALVVERTSGQRFGRFVEENIFAPLGMSDSVIRDSSEPEIPNRVLGYARGDAGFTLDDDHNLNHIIGSGGMYSTVEDLASWDEALYTDTLVRRETLEEAWSPVRLAGGDEFPYGFGWRLGGYGGLGRRVCHSGHWLGFSTFITRYPERGLTVIVLSNIGDFESEEFAGRIVDLIYPSTLIAGAAVVDGTGEPRFTVDVRIEGDRIADIGDLEPGPDEPVVDGRGLVLAPGFIDTHSHADTDTFDHRNAVAAVSQGITTTVVGQDGESRMPLGEFFARLETEPAAINMASYTGHGSIRVQVMGDDFARAATQTEIASMEVLLAEDMAAGSLGLSTGLEYDPGIYSTTERGCGAGTGGGEPRRPLHEPPPQRRPAVRGGDRRDPHDRSRGRPAGPDFARQACTAKPARTGRRAARDPRRSPGRRNRCDRRHLPLHLLAVDPDGDVPRPRLRGPPGGALRRRGTRRARGHADPCLCPRPHARRQDPGRDRSAARHRSGRDSDGSDPRS